ncbi:MAG: hypothetical protein KA792_06945, partial [Bacteroidales bacterium]|nr:hypothetical protein [Bacteroidales bacterium]
LCSIIYSKEPTTEFLSEITISLEKKYQNNISIFILDDNKKFKVCYSFIEKISEEDIILYLGHGNHKQLYGPLYSDGEKSIFIKEDKYDIFENKNLFCLSCNSNCLIKKLKLKNGIGFGELITDYNHILALRESDVTAYSELTENSISLFNSILNNILIGTISDLFDRNLSFTSIYDFYMLRLNKEINHILLNKDEENIKIYKLLFQMKWDSLYLKLDKRMASK